MSGAPTRALRLVARFGLAGLFLYAGAVKLADPAGFIGDLDHYRLLPESLSPLAALALPVFEVVAGLALALPGYVRGGALLSAAMLLAFAVAMTQAKLRGINLACGCFGAGSDLQVSWAKVTLDLLLAMLAVWLVSMPEAVPPLVQTASGESA